MDLVERARNPAPEEVLRAWAREWAKEGVALDWEKLICGADVFMDRPQQEDELRDYERFLCASGEAFVYAAMICLMTRRLVRV